MRKARQDIFQHNGQCAVCQYDYDNTCTSHTRCSTCPMYYKPRGHQEQEQESWRVIRHNCHCLTPLTTEERKSGKCKFFKQKEDK